MSLLNRLIGTEEPKIAVHQFWAAMEETANGEMTVQEIKDYLQMSEEDSDEFDWLIGKYQASTDKPRFLYLMHVLYVLAEIEAPGYGTQSELQARINRIP